MSGKTDLEQLEYSTEHDRVIYTFNIGDFCGLHREFIAGGKSHTGIIVVYRQRYSLGEQIRRLSDLINPKRAEDMRNGLHFQ